MKKISTIFLQAVIVFIGIITFSIMIRFPLNEGRAENLDILSIYSDPFILYVYAGSIIFYITLYKTFLLLGYIRQNKVFSLKSLITLKSIKYYTIILSILILTAGVYIRIFHNKNDDPVGFLVICIITTFVSIIITNIVSIFEKILQKAIDIKSENELKT